VTKKRGQISAKNGLDEAIKRLRRCEDEKARVMTGARMTEDSRDILSYRQSIAPPSQCNSPISPLV
jgi:hypothetical protein